MLQFFRKYQSYFFAITTFVIIISFSFFGTYNALPSNANRDQVAFTAVDGSNIPRSDLDEMVAFIGTDNDDKRIFGGAWGPNFLNDGFIKQDLLQTGLAQILVEAYPDLIAQDLQPRLEKEKRFALYAHPQAKFLTAEAAWAYFAPNMKSNFDLLRKADNAVSPEAFDARVALFLDERRFPAPMLRQVLRYQQKQYSWLSPDPSLEHADLSLFGYHTIDDWFGPRFLRVIAEFTINSSKIAEQKGYKVSREEAMADLMRNAEISFQQNINNPYLGVANSAEYFNEQLRHLNMDQNMAAKIWRQVLLFRRLFHDVGNAALVDPLTHQQFYAYAQEAVEGDLYRLPEELRFNDYRALQKFEIYLDAVAGRSKDSNASDKTLLALPTKFLTAEEVKKNTPELVQKRYLLLVAQVNKKDLQTKVGLKEMWNWEVEDKNWERLKTEFPDLGIKQAATREQRTAALDSLDDRTRARVDAFARAAVVESHPEWLQKALQEAEAKQMLVGMRPTGGNSFVVGLDNRKELIRLLDTAALGTQENTDKLPPEAKEISDKLSRFTADKNTFYRVTVLERTPKEEVLTFAEANSEGILDQLLDRKMEEYYGKIRDQHPADFQQDDKAWKPYADVKTKVADLYFDKLLKAIRNDYASANKDKNPPSTTGDWAASHRFNSVARELQAKLKKNPADAETLVRQVEQEAPSEEHLQQRSSLADQWKWVKAPYQVHRGTKIEDLDIDKEEILALGPDAWTIVHAPINGDLFFFQMKQKVNTSDIAATYDKLHEAHGLLADDAQRTYMHRVVGDLKANNAISLDYLDRNVESMEQPEVQENS